MNARSGSRGCVGVVESAPEPGESRLRFEPITDIADHVRIEQLYRVVFGVGPEDGSINARLLIALTKNSGTVVGAYHGSELVGFAYGFLSRDPVTGELYQYSQTAGVAPHWQGRGVGRGLKLAQREQALALGLATMRWAYDPMQARNAHFNLDVLGGRAREFVPAMYGAAVPGRDRGERSDRLIITWDLTREPPNKPGHGADPLAGPCRPPGETWRSGERTMIAIPARWDHWRAALSPVRASALRARVADQLALAIGSGNEAVSCRRVDADTAVYVLTPAAGAAVPTSSAARSVSSTEPQEGT